jgi:hypothetical protein
MTTAFEPARQALRNLQNTIDGLMPAGPIPPEPNGLRDLGIARENFFGPAPPGAQRTILKTGATIPGGDEGILLSRFYIANKSAAFGLLDGDGRPATSDPNATYRFAIAWDTRTGEVSVTVSSSTFDVTVSNPDDPEYGTTEKQTVPALPISTQPGEEPNNVVVTAAEPNHLRLDYSMLNSVTPIGEANGTLDISVDPRYFHIGLKGDDYPDGEFVQYRPEGTRTLATKDMAWAQELTVFDNVVVGQIDNTYNHPR